MLSHQVITREPESERSLLIINFLTALIKKKLNMTNVLTLYLHVFT